MSVQMKLTPAGDVFLHVYEFAGYTNEQVTITNSGQTAMRLPAGYPLRGNTPQIAANVSGSGATNPDGLLAQALVVEAGTAVKATVIARGPVVINADALPATDYAGASFVAADLLSAVEAGIPALISASESDKQTTQTT